MKQVNNASHDPVESSFRVDGHELTHVRLIGMVVAVNPRQTNVSFTITDGTASVEVKRFYHAEENEKMDEEVEKYRKGSYVIVTGRLSMYQEVINFTAEQLKPLEDWNQLTHHFLQVIHTHLLLTRGRLKDGLHTTPMKGAAPPNFHTPTQKFSGMAMQTPQQEDSEFNPAQQMVLRALDASMSEEGTSIQHITSQLAGRLTSDDISNALNYLTNEGHVYSTIDEFHFKKTE